MEDGVGGGDLRGGEGGGEDLGHRGDVLRARLLRHPLEVLVRRSCIIEVPRRVSQNRWVAPAVTDPPNYIKLHPLTNPLKIAITFEPIGRFQ